MESIPSNKKSIKIMGVLNITPDSFSDGGSYFNNIEIALKRVKEMIGEGADIIDVGGESTRPGSDSVNVDEELRRVVPVIKAIRDSVGKNVDISVDTNKSEVAREAIKVGANIINSLGGFSFDRKLADVVKESDCLMVIYHIKGSPKTMQEGEIVYEDIISEIKDFFDSEIKFAESNGIPREKLLFDPGIGFGKTVEQNIEIIKRLKEFKDMPIVVGISRKSHLGKILQESLHLSEVPPPNERLEAGLAETAVAVLNGACVIRTHDVAETKKFLAVLEKFFD